MADVVRQDVVEIDIESKSALDALIKLSKEFDDLKKKLTGGLGDDAMDDLKDKTEDSVSPMKKLKEQVGKLHDKLNDVGKKSTVAAFNGLKKIAGISLKALTVGLGAAAAGVATLAAKAVSAYADFEQLKGGVETLFGAGGMSIEEYAKSVGKSTAQVKDKYKDLIAAQDQVFKNANDAYKTAGLSANEYMETVTSFSASLVSSLGGDTKKAAEYSHTAIVDMSDNANKMGTDMGLLQNTYQGFAKQNYTMLDNLKLGYGGTKTEMERLVKDAAKLDKSIDANSLSFGNIVKAIHAVQDEMGITGTTQKEAEKTITGSLNAVKSAWKNLMPALIQGGDQFDQCVDNLLYSTGKFMDNIKPAITSALRGIGKLVEEIAPKIAEEFPKLVDELLPPLLSAAGSIIQGLIKALPTLVMTLVKEIPKILKMVWDAIVDTFGEYLPFLKSISRFFEKNAGSIEGFFAKAGNAIVKFLPIILALVGAFKLFKGLNGLSGITSLFGGGKGGSGGGKGGVFGGLVDNLKSLAKVKTKTVLKGMANLAIILGGFALLAGIIIAVSPIVAMIADWGSVAGIILSIAALGAVGAGLAKLGEIVGRVKVSTVAKGLANMAIMIAGMSVLLLLVGAVSLIPFDYKRVLGLVGLIGALGVVGGALALFAGIIGTIPIPVVASGLASMAIVIGGLSVLLLALAALNSIPGFNEFIKTGGELLITIFNIIGRVVGSLVGGVLGGIGEGLTASLIVMGENLSKFAESVKPALETFSTTDVSGISQFLGAFAGFMLQMTGEKFLSFFTGDIDFGKLGSELTKFANGSKQFFEKVSKFPEDGFKKGTALFECLAGLSKLPHTGGVVQWFCGEVDYGKISDGLAALSNKNVETFFAFVGKMDTVSFDNATKLFECLAGLSKLPSSGGVVQWFCGEVDYGKISNGLASLSNEGVKKFFEFTAGLSEDGTKSATSLFECLSGLSKLPNSGGLAQWFSGEVDYAKIANGLASLSNEGVKKFFTFVNGIDEAGINKSAVLFEGFAKLGQLPNSGGIASWFCGEVDYGKVASGLATLADQRVKDFFVFASGIEETSLDKGLKVFSCLAGLSQLPSSGGIANWFCGEVDYGKVASGLDSLSNDGVKRFFTFVGGLEEVGITNATKLFECLAGLSQLPSSGGIAQWFCGEVDYGKVAGGLNSLSNDGVKRFFTFVSTLEDTAVSNATNLFSCLAGLSQLPSSGGVVQWFCGEVDYFKIAEGLRFLSRDGVKRFFEMVSNLSQTAFNNGTTLFSCLSGMGGLPNSGGIASWFSGSIDYENIEWALWTLSKIGVQRFFEMTQNLSYSAFSNAPHLFWSLNGLADVKGTNGVDYANIEWALWALSEYGAQRFFQMTQSLSKDAFSNALLLFSCLNGLGSVSNNTANIAEVGANLSSFAVSAGSFFSIVNDFDAENFTAFISALGKITSAFKELGEAPTSFAVTVSGVFSDSTPKVMDFGNITATTAAESCDAVSKAATVINNVVTENISDLTKKVTELPELMGNGIKSTGNALADALVSIWEDAVKASAKPINKLIDGANWVLKQFGASEKLASWIPYSSYAKGTKGHKGGNALVNDGRGAELVQMPNGNSFIPNGRNVMIPNAPQGMKVLPAENTAQLMGRSTPTFRYADGVGNIDIWSYIDNYKGLVGEISKGISYEGVNGFFAQASKGIVSSASGSMAAWVEKMFDKYGAKSLADYVASAGVEQWRSTVIRALKMEGQYSEANVQRTLYQMQTESGGNPMAINLWDSNAKKGVPSKGLMQVIDPTFAAYARAGYNTNIYDPLSNILASIRYAISRYGSLARAYRGVGYENGGLVTKTGLIAEQNKPEMVIPLDQSKRKRSIGLWETTGNMLGLSSYTPESDGEYYTTNTVENNTYSPQFTLNISGTTDEREMSRRVKRWIAEAMEDTFTGMANKTKPVREV